MKVSDILQRKPISGVASIGPNESLATLAQTLTERKIGAMVVTDPGGRMIGVISERDVIRALSAAGPDCLNETVSQYMTSKVVVAAPDDSAVSVLERMTAGRFRHMPVLENGKLTGVVSIGDLVKHRIEMLQRDNEALEEFIRS